jgi:hypothetical protein
LTQHPSTPCQQALARLLSTPPISVVVWGLVVEVDPFREALTANGLGDPSTWEHGPGDSRFVGTPHTHLRTAQEELYMDLLVLRNQGGNRFGLAFIERSMGRSTLTFACSGWKQDTTLTQDKLAFPSLPGPTGIVERFGLERFTLATSGHAALAHLTRWP